MNQPDLVLFVGEALVGNDAIDQLVKFNQSIADHSNMENPRLIDGIVLTKFDTIDDKVRDSSFEEQSFKVGSEHTFVSFLPREFASFTVIDPC